MVSDSIGVDGCVTFWTVGEWSYHSLLKQGLEALGLGKQAPEPRTGPACLRDALEEVFPSRSHRVEPLKKRDAFEVIRVERGDESNTYAPEVVAAIDRHQRITLRPYSWELSEQVTAAFDRHLGLVRTSGVSGSLVGVLDSLGGTRLRPSGAIYWLPGHKLDEWARVGEVVKGASKVVGANRLYLIRHRLDGDAVKAVRDAIVAEIQREARELHEQVMTGELGERALESRKAQALEMERKIGLYEDLLSVGLSDLRDVVGKVEEAIGGAGLLLAAGAVS